MTYLPHGKVLAFAHRGGAYHPEIEGLENTMAAFRHAAALGYTLLTRDPARYRDYFPGLQIVAPDTHP